MKRKPRRLVLGHDEDSVSTQSQLLISDSYVQPPQPSIPTFYRMSNTWQSLQTDPWQSWLQTAAKQGPVWNRKSPKLWVLLSTLGVFLGSFVLQLIPGRWLQAVVLADTPLFLRIQLWMLRRVAGSIADRKHWDPLTLQRIWADSGFWTSLDKDQASRHIPRFDVRISDEMWLRTRLSLALRKAGGQGIGLRRFIFALFWALKSAEDTLKLGFRAESFWRRLD